jgi:hypothetical protein
VVAAIGTGDFNARIMRRVLRYSDTWKDLGKPETTIEQFAVRPTTGNA